MKLSVPTKAIRMKPSYYRKSYSPWHFQKPDKMNKTICGITIASGRGYKMRNDAFWKTLRKTKQLWEGKLVNDIKQGKFCATCLGAIKIS